MSPLRHPGPMPWVFTDDVEEYFSRAWDVLAAQRAENTIALTVIDSARAGHRWSADPMLFGWYDASPVSGAVLMTPPFNLHLPVVPAELVAELVAALRAKGVR